MSKEATMDGPVANFVNIWTKLIGLTLKQFFISFAVEEIMTYINSIRSTPIWEHHTFVSSHSPKFLDAIASIETAMFVT